MNYEVTVKGRQVFLNGEKCKSLRSKENYDSGGYRWIYLTPDNKILKLDYIKEDDELYNQTQAEIRMWPQIKWADRRHFPQLIATGFRGKHNKAWLIEEYLEIDKNFRATGVHTKLVRQLKRKYKIDDIYPKVGTDNHNWGATVRGRIVIWDYGFNRCGLPV